MNSTEPHPPVAPEPDAPLAEDEGTYFWAGAAATYFWIDPIEQIVAFAWTQSSAFGRVPIDPILREVVADALRTIDHLG